MMSPMATNVQHVILQGGSFDGRLAEAPPPPGTLRLGCQKDSDKWSELYIYTAFELAASHEKYGDLPVMVYAERRDEV
jgi:hypothetical protein